MNEIQNSRGPADDDLRFDRLVDGELTADEHRALVASLDDEPGGWRRCALAFLESQALTGELTAVRRGLDLDNESGSGVPGKGNAHWSQGHLRRPPLEFGTLLAVAASFLVALAIGVAAPGIWSQWTQEPSLAGNNESQNPSLVGGLSPHRGSMRHEALKPIGNLRLVMDGLDDEGSQSGQVPVYEVEQGLEQFLTQAPSALAPELVELLQERGHDVQMQQQYMLVELDDGRQVIVPVEGYQITPVGRRAY